MVSIATRSAIYDACGITVDTNKGTVAGIVVDENDQELAGAVVFLTPDSGEVYYLDNTGTPDSAIISTGPSGAFVILNVEPGGYQISAVLEGYSFSPVISVNANALTGDALIGSSSDSISLSDSSSSGCFISTAAHGSLL